ncbi:MAG: hypothetical protein PVF17_08920 [Ignavibacteria bacterium]
MDKEIITKEFKKTKYIFISLLIGQIIFFCVSLFIVDNKFIDANIRFDGIFKFFIPLVGVVAMFLANKIYNLRIKSVQPGEKLEVKLNKYRSFKLMQWVIVEAAGFLSLFVFIITRDYLYSIVFLFLIGYFYLLRPSRNQLKSDMKI